MRTLRTIRLRIKGTKSIKQITRAMEAVSAVKMRKSQGVALAARPFAVAALQMLQSAEKSVPEEIRNESPFLQKREVRNVLLVVITSDKGLAGPFNANVLKKAEQFIRQTKATVALATVGKKAAEYFSRRNQKPADAQTGYGDIVELAEVEHVFDFVKDSFVEKKADEVSIVYTNFLSAMKQEVVVRKLLPFSEEGLAEMVRGIVPEKGKFAEVEVGLLPHLSPTSTEYIFEPSPKEIFAELLPSLLKVQVYHAILEANASEHSSRMIAMRNATDNAGELIKTYTVSLNKARQAAINKELAEISGGAEALTT